MEQASVAVYRVSMVKEKRQKVESTQLSSAADAATIFQRFMADRDREVFAVLLLSVKHQVIGINTVSIGTLDSSLVHPREVYKPAVLLGASSIVVAHNHPSGDSTPSTEDRRVTSRLVEAGKILGIDLLDHLIITADGFLSMKQSGML